MHTAVFEPGADQPSPLIRQFNAIMPVGAASVSSLAPSPPLLTLQFQFFEGENPPDTNIYLLLLSIFSFYFFIVLTYFSF